MRRVIAPIAAALLALSIAGPVAADPTVQQKLWPHEYVVTCSDVAATEVPNQVAHGVPGWGLDWAPGDTPWLLLGFTMTWDGGSYVKPTPPGLVDNGKLIGACTITWDNPWGTTIKDAYFLQR